jgi:hypothetical protein
VVTRSGRGEAAVVDRCGRRGFGVDRRVEVVEVQVPGGGVIFAEVEGPAGGDAGWRAGRRFSLEEVRANVVSIGSWVFDTVRGSLPQTPDKVGVEFGLKLTAKTGSLVAALAEAGGEASVVVKLEWSTLPPSPSASSQVGSV